MKKSTSSPMVSPKREPIEVKSYITQVFNDPQEMANYLQMTSSKVISIFTWSGSIYVVLEETRWLI
jgi:glycine/serine hydroxymethyltransferase